MRGLASAAIVVLLGTAVYAHHLHPDFLLDQDATVEGTIESIQFQNPHVLITVRAADSILYTAEWKAAYLLKDTQSFPPVNRDTLNVGDRIVVVGCPPRDPARHELVLLKEVRRPRDEWRWTCRRPLCG